MTMFDASAFLESVINEANSTSIKPAPEGEYVGQILPLGEDSIKQGVSRAGNPWVRLDLFIEIVGDPRIKQACGLDRKTIRAGIMLDTTENGGLAMGEGKNLALGRLRAAVGLNIPGQPFSLKALGGKMVKISVKHRPDDRDPSVLYEDVRGFLPAFQ